MELWLGGQDPFDLEKFQMQGFLINRAAALNVDNIWVLKAKGVQYILGNKYNRKHLFFQE